MSFFKKPVFIISIIVVALFIGAHFYFSGNNTANYDFAVAKKGNIVQEVSVTGKVKPASSVNLAFEIGGKVVWLGNKVGDKVSNGQTLVRLNDSNISAQLSQANANVIANKAKLEELKNGTRPEEIKIQEAKVKNAQIMINESKKSLINALQDAYSKSDDAIRNKIDQFFSNPSSSNPKLDFVPLYHSALKTNIENDRASIEKILVDWKISLDSLSTSTDLSPYINKAHNNINKIKSFLDETAFAVNSLIANVNHSQSVIDGWKSSVSISRNNVNLSATNLLVAVNGFKSAESALTLAESELSLEKAGATSQQITAQNALVASAEANVLRIKSELNNTILRSPINGVITNINTKIGEIIAPNVPVVSIDSEKHFKIEANVPEADIAKIKIGQIATLTLDAYGDNTLFKSKVVLIAPSATVIEGVPTYKVTFQFINEDKRIKPGMTANLNIVTGTKKNVIVIPQRSVIENSSSENIVRVVGKDGVIKKRKVIIGLKGSLGNVEAISGVKEGDKVIIFMKQK